jgi:gas vesicle protein
VSGTRDKCGKLMTTLEDMRDGHKTYTAQVERLLRIKHVLELFGEQMHLSESLQSALCDDSREVERSVSELQEEMYQALAKLENIKHIWKLFSEDDKEGEETSEMSKSI